ncbi:putative site-specific recombinase [Oscillibacter valericigenes Sjm18-20]|nr:putative site-specific recombinase [Oscillibacter valericigenes Sjm18-20]
MSRRGENVYKRKDGRWEGRILRPDGKYRYVYAKTYKEVKDKQKNYEKYIKPQDNKIDCPVANAAGLFDCWLSGDILDQVKPSTYENYYRCIKNYVIPFFKTTGNENLSEITAAQFTKHIKNYSALSESYKRKILIIFKTALKEILKGSPKFSAIMGTVILPKAGNKEVQAFSINEQRLIENAAYHSKDKRALGIILTFYTGIRLGELCALKWNDIDCEAGVMSVTKTVTRVNCFQPGRHGGTLLVGTPKSQKSIRKIPLPEFLVDMYKKYISFCMNENCYLISGTTTPEDPRSYQKLYKKVLAAAGVNNRKFHAIRHTFATRAMELGIDIKTLSEILGHSNVSTTLNIYAHSLMEQKKIAMNRFNELHITHMESTLIAVKSLVVNA